MTIIITAYAFDVFFCEKYHNKINFNKTSAFMDERGRVALLNYRA